MKPVHYLVVLLIGFVTALLPLLANDANSTNQITEVRNIENARLQALVDGKVDLAKQFHAEDFQLISPGGMTFTRDEYLKALGSGQLKYFVFEAESPIEEAGQSEGVKLEWRLVRQGKVISANATGIQPSDDAAG